MQIRRGEYIIETIDEPLPKHIIAFEREVRRHKSASLKHLIEDAGDALKMDFAAASQDAIVQGVILASRKLNEALRALAEAETLTATADDVVIVKSAVASGWIIACLHNGAIVPLDNVDELSPAWLVAWIARVITEQYANALTIPKN